MVGEKFSYRTQWKVRRYASEEAYRADAPSAVIDADGQQLPGESEIEGNVLLNEGIALLLDLLIGAGGTHYGNANAYIGVGNDSTAASATQTGLLGTSTAYRPMESGYPQRSGQTVTWRAVFGANDGNFSWNEFTIANANSNSGTNLNRRVSAQGTKASGQIWTVDVSITIS
jgi:hypothetical protein